MNERSTSSSVYGHGIAGAGRRRQAGGVPGERRRPPADGGREREETPWGPGSGDPGAELGGRMRCLRGVSAEMPCVVPAALCTVLLAGAFASQPQQGQATGIGQDSRGNHRVKLIFPLLIRISLRLAELVPMVGMVKLLLLALVIFAKKAFLVSLATLGVVVLDKLKRAPVRQPPASQHKHVYVRPVVKEKDVHHSSHIYNSEEDYRRNILLNGINPDEDDSDSW